MIPNLKERLSWHFSLIARWWITHDLSLDKIPLAMMGCASEDDFFKLAFHSLCEQVSLPICIQAIFK
jgi:hypothetical protein